MKLLDVSSIVAGDHKGKVFYVYTDDEKEMITAYHIKEKSEADLWEDCASKIEDESQKDRLFQIFKAIKDSLFEFSNKVGFVVISYTAEEQVHVNKGFENYGINDILKRLAKDILIKVNEDKCLEVNKQEDVACENRRSFSC